VHDALDIRESGIFVNRNPPSSNIGIQPRRRPLTGNILPGGKWPNDEYDWRIELRFDENGRLIDSKRINENLTPADAAKPTPAAP
jgi:hypothetical protein